MYILKIKLHNDIYTYPYTDKPLALKEFYRVLDTYYRGEAPSLAYYKDIQYYKSNDIEITLDYYRMNDKVAL